MPEVHEKALPDFEDLLSQGDLGQTEPVQEDLGTAGFEITPEADEEAPPDFDNLLYCL